MVENGRNLIASICCVKQIAETGNLLPYALVSQTRKDELHRMTLPLSPPALLSVITKTANFVPMQDVATAGPELHTYLHYDCSMAKLSVNKNLCVAVAFGQSL